MRLTTLAMIALSASVAVDAHAHSKGHKAHLKAKGVQTTVDAQGDIDDQFGSTPYVRQLANGQWEGGVPNYEDLTQPMWKREFSAEGEAKAWAYSKTGAAQSIQYEEAEAGKDPTLEQVTKEGRSANNSNNKKAEDNPNVLEKPIIDAKLIHTADKTYHTNTVTHEAFAKAGANKETAAALQAAKKAAKNAAWSKSVSARNHMNGGNDRLTKKQLKKTKGAKDAKDARSVKLTKLGAKMMLIQKDDPAPDATDAPNADATDAPNADNADNSASVAGVAGLVGSMTLMMAGFLLL